MMQTIEITLVTSKQEVVGIYHSKIHPAVGDQITVQQVKTFVVEKRILNLQTDKIVLIGKLTT